jgi:DNA modification methylase
MPGLPALSIPAMTCGLGEETTPEAYIGHLILVMREMWRVLRDDGTCFVNLGDSYASDIKGSGGPSKKQTRNAGSFYSVSQRLDHGLKPKDLCLIPARFALAAQADGWYIRSDIIWAKKNCMPESVTDRPTKSHEYVWLMSKSQRYFYDAEAVKEASGDSNVSRILGNAANDKFSKKKEYNGLSGLPDNDKYVTRNRRTVWNIATSPYSGAHFATWPPKLVQPMILAGTSARGVCPACGSQWERVVERTTGDNEAQDRPKKTAGMDSATSTLSLSGNGSKEWAERGGKSTTTGWQPTCECPPADPIPATVLDPFNGSGTSGTVALDLGRAYIGVDISTEYVTELAEERIGGTQIGFGL